MRILLLLLAASVLVSCGKKAEQTSPKNTSLTESVYASITVQPQDMYNVFTTMPGIIDKIYVKDGDSVRIGDVIAHVSSSKSALYLESASINEDLAREKYKGQTTLLSSVSEEIKSTSKQLKIDSLNFKRQKALRDENVGTQLDFDQAKLRYELTQGNLAKLKLKYSQTNVELENAYKMSQNSMRKVQSDIDDLFIRSTINGRVYSILKHQGELVLQQEVLAQIGRKNNFVLDLMVDEVDISKVSVGQPVIVNLDAFKGQVFDATITRIYPIKDKKTQTFKLEARLTNPPINLFAGLAGEANIVISKKENIITIPLEYLIEGSKVNTNKGEVEVKTGLSSLEEIEIISGLDTKAIIFKPTK